MSFKYLIYVQHILEILIQFYNLDFGTDVVKDQRYKLIRSMALGDMSKQFSCSVCACRVYLFTPVRSVSVIVLGEGERKWVEGLIFFLEMKL